MGIPGLTTYLCDNPEAKGAWDRFDLKDTRLVIDGLSLLGLLLGSSGKNGGASDLRCGGQYQEFYCRVSDFFAQLRSNGVDPIIIMDGVSGGDAKLFTTRKRVGERIAQQHRLSHCRDQREVLRASEVALPPWAGPVMTEALTDIGVPCITADGEADAVTAALARQWGCPVLSNDSDFFVFDLPGGLIHLRDLNVMKPCETKVRRYRRSRLLQSAMWKSFACDVSEGLLALAAGLAGNDYVTGDEVRYLRPLYGSYHGSHFLVKALFWLVAVKNSSTLDEGLLAVERGLPAAVKDKVMTCLRYSVDFYDVTTERRTREAACLVDPDSVSKTTIQPSVLCGVDAFPAWLVSSFRLGGFPSAAVSAAQDQRHSQTGIYMEDVRHDPISKADMKLRGVVYGVVLAAGTQAKPIRVAELARGSGSTQVQDIYVEAARSFHGLKLDTLPSIDEMERLSVQDRAEILLSSLDSLGDLVASLPTGWQFPVATIRHWILTSAACSQHSTCLSTTRHNAARRYGQELPSPGRSGVRNTITRPEPGEPEAVPGRFRPNAHRASPGGEFCPCAWRIGH